MTRDIIAQTGMWLLMDSRSGILITARGNEMLAWSYMVLEPTPFSEAIQISAQPVKSRIFKHLDHEGEPDADQLPMRGLIILAKEFMQEILFKKELG